MGIFDYTDYKKFLNQNLGHGQQKKFASYLGCQPAFLSQVLRANPDLSLEQGILATEYFSLNASESEYFMLALQYSRAGSVTLKLYFEGKMLNLCQNHQRVDSRIGHFEKLDEKAKAIFYSSWKYSFLYVLLSIPCDNQIEMIKSKSKLSDGEILKVINDLAKMGLIHKTNGTWLPTKKRIHLGPEDIQIGSHHKNYRSLCARELEELKKNSLHFSSAIALSKSDAQKIKDIFLKSIESSELIIKPSKEETVRILCVDFFEPGYI